MMLLNPYRFAPSGGGGGTLTWDPQWANVALLIRADGTISDDGPSARVLTPVGASVASATQSRWGGGSLRLPGLTDYVRVAGAGMTIGTQDFALQMWLMPDVLSSMDWSHLWDTTTGESVPLKLIIDSTNVRVDASNTRIMHGAHGIVVANQGWHFVALRRAAGVAVLEVNGVQVASAAMPQGITAASNLRPLIGSSGYSPGSGGFVGYIDDLRLTIGHARDAAVPTAPFPQGAAAGPGPTAYQHWRLYVTANDGDIYVSFSEIELLDGATVLTDPSNPNDLSPSQSGDDVVGSAAAGVDNIADTSCGGSWAGGPYWWQIDLGAAHPVSSMTLRSQHAVTGRTPTTFVLQGSASSSGPWTDVITVTGSTGWGIQEQRTFTA